MTAHSPDSILSVEVWRGDEKGAYRRYDVPQRENQTVLDVVTWIQRNREPTLAYRFACRVGVCGSCAMTVNGRPRWTCRTHVSKVSTSGRLRLEPLRDFRVIRDLVADMSVFFEKWRNARGRFEAALTRDDPLVPIRPQSKERRAADAAIECINCGVCYSACDVVRWNADYLGPAALNRAWAAYNDTRDADRDGVLSAVARSSGCHNCHSHQSCADHCPVGLNPTASIAGLKRLSIAALLKGELRA